MKLSERIYDLRKQRALSQEQLAEALGVSRQTVSKWECGTAAPELEKLRAIADYFGVTLDELTGSPTPGRELPRAGRAGAALCLLGALGLVTVGALLLFAPERAAALNAASAVTLSGSGIALLVCLAAMLAGAWLILRRK